MTDVRNIEKGDLITGIVFLMMGLLAAGEGLRLAAEPLASRLHYALAPGYYVLILGVLLIASSVAYLSSLYLSRVHGAAIPDANTSEAGRGIAEAEGGIAEAEGGARAVRNVILIMAMLAGYAALAPGLGYVPATFIFSLVAFRFFGVRNWAVSLASAACLTGAFYVVFIYYLGLVLPRGLLEGFI